VCTSCAIARRKKIGTLLLTRKRLEKEWFGRDALRQRRAFNRNLNTAALKVVMQWVPLLFLECGTPVQNNMHISTAMSSREKRIITTKIRVTNLI
jgi:hypothetical protein